MKKIENKFVAYLVLFLTFGYYHPQIIALKTNFEKGSLKEKFFKVTNVLWAIIFFDFFWIILITSLDSFFINRAVLIKFLTRGMLSLVAVIFILDTISGIVKGSDKAKKA